MVFHVLERLGLTPSEARVYIALLELGPSTAGPITHEAKVASSKTYSLLEKLLEKGLITTYKEGGVHHFKAAEPDRLRDYLHEREAEFRGVEEELDKVIPQLEIQHKEHHETEVEAFKGYRGAETVFREMFSTLKKGEEYLVIGGGDAPTSNERTRTFFERVHRERAERGIKLRIILAEARRQSFKEQTLFPHTDARFLPWGTPSTINIYKDTTVLMTMSPHPAAIRIRNEQITRNYRAYFETMWKHAKA